MSMRIETRFIAPFSLSLPDDLGASSMHDSDDDISENSNNDIESSEKLLTIGSPSRSLQSNLPKSIHFSDSPPQIITVDDFQNIDSTETVFVKPFQNFNSRIMVALIVPGCLFLIFIILHIVYSLDNYLE